MVFQISELDYTFTDSYALRNSKLFYRLQIQNTDGSSTYSDIRTITSDRYITSAFTFFPNPAKGQVQIYLDDYTQPVIMTIYDNSGKKIKEQTLNQQNTSLSFQV